MSAALPSDEVALDFQDSLQDLQNNNRYEISNLTIIAKENTEHAQAISQVLEKHIRTTAPTRKLPALYVLDSIVKNVGSPYTIYLSRNLFSTFMDAYTLVGNDVRKAMDAMLKTWKEPVPGSSDPTPVFLPDTTRPIENALIKFRTVAVQQQQQHSRNQRPPLGLPQRPISNAFRNTPTPPQHDSQFALPGQVPYQNGYTSQNPTPQPPFPPVLPTDTVRSLSALLNGPTQELQKLKGDIEGLIASFRTEFARSPFDTTVQSKLKALLDLQTVVNTQTLPPQAINAIKAQVGALQAAQSQTASAAGTPSAAPPQTSSQWQPPTPLNPAPFQPPSQLPQGFARPSSTQPPAPALPYFAPGALEQLLKSTAQPQHTVTPTLPNAIPNLANLTLPVANPSPRPAAATSAPAPSGNALMDALRAAGLVQGTGAPAQAPLPPPPPPPQVVPTPSLLQQLQGLIGKNPNAPAQTRGTPYISLSAPNLKTFRPELVHSLYEAQPNQCTTCGRRFQATEEGRAKKARHLDWHFRTNQRIAEAVHKGQNRSWYLDEMEWIQLRDIDTSSAPVDDSTSSTSPAKDAKKKNIKDNYIPAPTGAAAVQNAACPICQEKFETVWHEEAQEWVWMDATRAGGRIYHASCHDEVSKASAGPTGFVLGQDRARSATPEMSILGKRKAEGDMSNLKTKLKREVVS
ncbi:hypothetical protein AAFC00_005236 [Neodothiora populina]|uniref:CID domain-containing protein n=1 Tax=Neodothiora populina TaxID=2781224 RepID=A0ABR3PLB3_9PEZI